MESTASRDVFNMSPFAGTSIRLFLLIAVSITLVSSMELFNVKFVELDDSRLIATSNYNYALTSPKLSARGWRTVSVNGDSIVIATSAGVKMVKARAELGDTDRIFIENLRDQIANGNGLGFNHMSSSSGGLGGGGSMMMSSGSGMGISSSFSSSSSTGGGISTMTSGGGGGGYNSNMQINDMAISMKDESNFSVSKSDLPFGWSRIFFSGDLVTLVSRDGKVEMLPVSLIEPAKVAVINKIKMEVKAMQRSQAQQFSSTMQHSMDMVSNVFNSILGTFPKPPSYSSAVGNMFGHNFPFGPDNSPFSLSSGWPFGGGAMAFASARR